MPAGSSLQLRVLGELFLADGALGGLRLVVLYVREELRAEAHRLYVVDEAWAAAEAGPGPESSKPLRAIQNTSDTRPQEKNSIVTQTTDW
eukprot:CAMPEP_0198547210 /NCGR_PEP_ID=MMETSP1462-20131121/67429_1 /TAXON_ID=1333877 /ORGANISM="Brandtodinium nutriculum, Strain RCC3387" /LENGTH=89 /DNA_ID=CAMNT_0044277687 /DNA_START=204 /DNA_END=474 /DNA_ORIENTATION=+